MAPTATLGGARSDRFSPRSVSKWYWIDRDDVAAADGVPTRAEIDAGTDLTPAVGTVAGFTESSNFQETPDLIDHRNGKILDGISLDDGTIGFYAARNGTDAGAFFSTGDLGYVLHLTYGDTATSPYELFDVEVGSVSRGTETTGAKMVNVMFALQQKRDQTVPAAA